MWDCAGAFDQEITLPLWQGDFLRFEHERLSSKVWRGILTLPKKRDILYLLTVRQD